jgi:hypothetical protein
MSEKELPLDYGVLFKLGSWEIVKLTEHPNCAEALHHCDSANQYGVHCSKSYQIPGDEKCPGCDAIQPDEIQGLVQMYNYDSPVDEMYGRMLGTDMLKAWNKAYVGAILKSKGTIKGVQA